MNSARFVPAGTASAEPSPRHAGGIVIAGFLDGRVQGLKARDVIENRVALFGTGYFGPR